MERQVRDRVVALAWLIQIDAAYEKPCCRPLCSQIEP